MVTNRGEHNSSVKPFCEKPTFRWQWNGKLAIFALLFFPLTVGLGIWQLQRAEQKRTLANLYEERAVEVPIELSELDPDQGLQYLQVLVSRAAAETQRYFLLENRMRNGRVGYEVLWPVQLEDGQWLVINRGWVAAGLYRHELPDIPPLKAEQLGGYLYYNDDVPHAKELSKEDNSWPQRLNWISLPRIEQQFGEKFFPSIMRLETEADWPSTDLLTGWEVSSVSPEKHTGYAVQWFLMAFALVVLTLGANSNLLETLRYRRASKK